MGTFSAKRTLLFAGITIFTAGCSGLAFFFYSTSGESYFLIVASIVILIGLSNLACNILVMLFPNSRYGTPAANDDSFEPDRNDKIDNKGRHYEG